MTKREPIERVVRVRDRDFPGFLDMLRYDSCTVVTWGHDQIAGVYYVTLRSNPSRTPGYEFTDDRWASFGLTLAEKGFWPGH